MDITVWAGSNLLLYVENKVTFAQARSLLVGMGGYGDTGFGLDDLDKGNDHLRKAKYLVRDNVRPKFFALSAIGYRQLFKVEYVDTNNRFRLIESPEPFTAPLYSASPVGEPPPLTAVDAFAIELQHQFGDLLWLSPGSGSTAYNAYLASENADGILFGVYKNGEVWTDLKGLGRDRSGRLAEHLRECGVELEPSKAWAHWMVGPQRFNLNKADVVAVAGVVRKALQPS